jgi:hypothetical protein
MSAPNCFGASPRRRRPLQQAAKADWLTSGRGAYAYDLSSVSAGADCASLRFLSRQSVNVSLEQPLKVLNLFLLFDRHRNRGKNVCALSVQHFSSSRASIIPRCWVTMKHVRSASNLKSLPIGISVRKMAQS